MVAALLKPPTASSSQYTKLRAQATTASGRLRRSPKGRLGRRWGGKSGLHHGRERVGLSPDLRQFSGDLHPDRRRQRVQLVEEVGRQGVAVRHRQGVDDEVDGHLAVERDSANLCCGGACRKNNQALGGGDGGGGGGGVVVVVAGGTSSHGNGRVAGRGKNSRNIHPTSGNKKGGKRGRARESDTSTLPLAGSKQNAGLTRKQTEVYTSPGAVRGKRKIYYIPLLKDIVDRLQALWYQCTHVQTYLRHDVGKGEVDASQPDPGELDRLLWARDVGHRLGTKAMAHVAEKKPRRIRMNVA